MRRLRTVVWIAAVVAVVAGVVQVVGAGAQSADGTTLAEALARQSEIGEESSSILAQIDLLTTRDRDLVDLLAALEASVAATELRVQARRSELDEAATRKSAALDMAELFASDVQTLDELARERAVEAYINRATDVSAEALANPQSLNDALVGVTMIDAVGSEINEVIRQLRRVEVAQLTNAVEEDVAAAAAEAATALLNVELEQLNRRRLDMQAVRTEVNSRIAVLEDEASELAELDIEVRDFIRAEQVRLEAVREQARLAALEWQLDLELAANRAAANAAQAEADRTAAERAPDDGATSQDDRDPAERSDGDDAVAAGESDVSGEATVEWAEAATDTAGSGDASDEDDAGDTAESTETEEAGSTGETEATETETEPVAADATQDSEESTDDEPVAPTDESGDAAVEAEDEASDTDPVDADLAPAGDAPQDSGVAATDDSASANPDTEADGNADTAETADPADTDDDDEDADPSTSSDGTDSDGDGIGDTTTDEAQDAQDAEASDAETSAAEASDTEVSAAETSTTGVSAAEVSEAPFDVTESTGGQSELVIPDVPPVADASLMIWPLPGPVVSGFGNRVHPIYGTVRHHAGLDIDGDMGEAQVAALGGTVILVGWNGGYGKTVIIDHGDGIATLYAHMSDYAVTEGEVVDQGQVIGYVGSTGNSTGPHLHFEVRVDGTAVDPLNFLPAR